MRTKAEALERSVRAHLDRAPEWRLAARWAFAVFLFLVSVLFLVFLSWLLRGAGLWGDLAFAIAVTTGAFWIARRAAGRVLDEGPVRALPRAFATTIFVLVGGPVAYVTRPAGVAFLLAPIVVWAGFRIAYWRGSWPKRKPQLWVAEVAGVALLWIALLVTPSVGSTDRVPQAVPAAAAEGGEHVAAVAKRFRPLMFFDSGELRSPLDIQDAVADGRAQMCRKAVRDDTCEQVTSADRIDENLDYLTIADAPGTPRGGGDGSAYYYHVVRDDDRVYVDYWWFYSRNPSPVADKVFCGPGLRLPPFTCQEHAGDWEGLTVVLAPCEEGASDCEDVDGEFLGPEEIRYGQHEHVAAYDWDEVLAGLWSSLPLPTAPALRQIWESLVLPAVQDAGVRPVVFAARNSHASYPDACFGRCNQQTRDLPEARHDGVVPWVHNAECDGCLQPLPLTTKEEPALWNAFPGRWGEQRCILAGAYCDLSGAPRGPSFQRRYEDPSGEVVEICLGRTRSGAPRLEPC